MKVYTINQEQYRQGWEQMWDEARRENQQEQDINFHMALRSLETLEEAYGMDFSQTKKDIQEEYDAYLKVRDVQPHEVDTDRDEDGMLYYEEETSICSLCSSTLPAGREMCDQCKEDHSVEEAA